MSTPSSVQRMRIVIRYVRANGSRNVARTLSPAEAADTIKRLLDKGCTRLTVTTPERTAQE